MKSKLIIFAALFLVSALAIAGSVSSSPPAGGSVTLVTADGGNAGVNAVQSGNWNVVVLNYDAGVSVQNWPAVQVCRVEDDAGVRVTNFPSSTAVSNFPEVTDGGLAVNTSMTGGARVQAYSIPVFTDGGCVTLTSYPQRKTAQISVGSTTAEICVNFGPVCPVLGGNCFPIPARGSGLAGVPGFWAGNVGGSIQINVIANGTGDAGITFTEGW